MYGAGAGAAQKSGGSATLISTGLVNLDPIILILGLDGSESVKDEAGAKINMNYRIVHLSASNLPSSSPRTLSHLLFFVHLCELFGLLAGGAWRVSSGDRIHVET